MKRLKKILKITFAVIGLYVGLALITPFVGLLHDRSCHNQINYIASQFIFH